MLGVRLVYLLLYTFATVSLVRGMVWGFTISITWQLPVVNADSSTT